MRVPSGEKATDITQWVWPSKIERDTPVAESQTRTVLSSDPDTMRVPSGEKATALTVEFVFTDQWIEDHADSTPLMTVAESTRRGPK